jgi:WD40 repeat protein
MKRAVALLLLLVLIAGARAGPPRLDRYGDPLPAGAVARVGTVRLYQGAVAALVYTPDGKTLAAFDEYGDTIRLWDTATGKETAHFPGPKDGIHGLGLSPDGRWLAAAGWGPATVWRLDARPGPRAEPLAGAKDGTEAVVFSPDGKFLAAVMRTDRLLRVWEVGTWREVRQIGRLGNDFCLALGFLPDGKTLISACQDGSVRLWDVATGRPLRALVNFLDLNTFAVAPDGKHFAAIQGGTALRLWDIGTGKEVARIPGPRRAFLCLAFSPDGKMLAAAGDDLRVRFWDAATGKEARSWRYPWRVGRIAFAPDGKTLALGSCAIRFRDVASGKETLTLAGPPNAVDAVAFSEDSKTLITACEGGATGTWDAATGKPLAPPRAPPNGYAHMPRIALPAALACDGRRAAAVGKDRAVWVWDTATGRRLSRFGSPPGSLSRAGFSPDGKRVAAAHLDKKLRLWDAATGQQLREWDGAPDQDLRQFGAPYQGVYAPVFSPDGRFLATMHPNNSIRVWEAATGKEVRVLRWQSEGANCLAFSPDGKWLASGHTAANDPTGRFRKDGILIRVWDVATGRPIRAIPGDWYMTRTVVFSPDGRALAVAPAFNNSVLLWELASGRQRAELIGHRAEVRALAFSPDGRRLASGSADLTALIWDMFAGSGSVGQKR